MSHGPESRAIFTPNATRPVSLGTGLLYEREPRLGFQYHRLNSVDLHAKGRTATAGALHLRILELEARCFQRLYIIDDAAVQIHQ